ncbi:MAG: hypothetical protein HC878_09300 [Leptolyngbyaceae cyanobacterium SL_5_14]|nr:hypothetical protein [Leptolyngbyaceae cyanobacterium SL_5_14]
MRADLQNWDAPKRPFALTRVKPCSEISSIREQDTVIYDSAAVGNDSAAVRNDSAAVENSLFASSEDSWAIA